MGKTMKRRSIVLLLAVLMLLLQACGSKGLDGTSWKLIKMEMMGEEMPVEDLGAGMSFTKDKVILTALDSDPEEADYVLEDNVIKITSEGSEEVMEFQYDGKKITMDAEGAKMEFEKSK